MLFQGITLWFWRFDFKLRFMVTSECYKEPTARQGGLEEINSKLKFTWLSPWRLETLYGLCSRTNFVLWPLEHMQQTHIRQRRIRTYHHQIANFRNCRPWYFCKTRRYRMDQWKCPGVNPMEGLHRRVYTSKSINPPEGLHHKKV